jgi:diguanylate cyclase (GGDEF)-like protein/PAS domain S-box-containing protein
VSGLVTDSKSGEDEGSGAPQTRQGKLTAVAVGAVLTLLLLGGAGFAVVHVIRAHEAFLRFCSSLNESQSWLRTTQEEIAAITRKYVNQPGSSELRERAKLLGRFDAAVAALRHHGGPELGAQADKIASASLSLDEIEREAMALADAHETTRALALLSGAARRAAGGRFEAALAELVSPQGPHFNGPRARYEHAVRLARLAGAVAITLIVLMWAWILLRLHHWQGALGDLLDQRTRMAEALKASEERYALALAGANDGIWDWDLRANRLFYSPRWKWLLGYHEHEISDSPGEWLSRVHRDDRALLETAIRDHLDGATRLLDVEIRMITRQGQWRWMHVRGVAVRDARNDAIRMAGSMSDITRRKLAEEQLRHGAFYDPLTGLPNRTSFLACLEHAVARVRRHPDRQFALLFLDLDDFKSVNDRFGHATGDEVLAQIAARIPALLRQTDAVGRLGGDEFLVLVEDAATSEQVDKLSNQIEEAVRQPLLVAGTQIQLTVSIGIAFSSEPFTEPMDLVALADSRMYEVKSRRQRQGAAAD